MRVMQVLELLPEHLLQHVLRTPGAPLDDMLRALPASPPLHALALHALDPSIRTWNHLTLHSLSARAFRRACAAASTSFASVTALSLRGQVTTSHSLTRLIKSLPTLVILDLHDSALTVTGELATAMSEISSLEALDLSHNMIEDSLIRVASILPRLPHLHTLNLHNIVSRGWHLQDLSDAITQMPALQTLTIGELTREWSAPRRADLREMRVAITEFVHEMQKVATLRSLSLDFADAGCSFGETATFFHAMRTLTWLEKLSVSVSVRASGSLLQKEAVFVPDSIIHLVSLRMLELNLSGCIDFSSSLLSGSLRGLSNLEELHLGGDVRVDDTDDLSAAVSEAALMTRVVLRSTLDITPKAGLSLVTQLAAITHLQSLHIPVMDWSSSHAAPLQAAAAAMADSGRSLTFDLVLEPGLLEGTGCSYTAINPSTAVAASVQSGFLHSNADAGDLVRCMSGMTAMTTLHLRRALCAAGTYARLFDQCSLGALTQLKELSIHLAAGTCGKAGGEGGAVAILGLRHLQQLTALTLHGCGSAMMPNDISEACETLPSMQRLELTWKPECEPVGVLDVQRLLTVQTMVLECAPLPEIGRFCDSIVLLPRLRCLGLTACWFGDEEVNDAVSIVSPHMQQHVKVMGRRAGSEDIHTFV